MSRREVAVTALEGICCVASRIGARDVVSLALRALEALGETSPKGSVAVDGAVSTSRALTAAERARRYRASRRHVTNVTENVTASVTDRDACASLRSPSEFSSPSLFLNASLSLEEIGSSESTGAREGEPSRVTPESGTIRVQKAVTNHARGTRVPTTNTSPEDVTAFAEKWGCDTKHPEWPKFLDHWRGQAAARGVKLDWGATWRNWVRRAPGFAGPTPRAPLGGMQPAPATGRLWKVGQ